MHVCPYLCQLQTLHITQRLVHRRGHLQIVVAINVVLVSTIIYLQRVLLYVADTKLITSISMILLDSSVDIKIK